MSCDDAILLSQSLEVGTLEHAETFQLGAADCELKLGRAPTIGPRARKKANAAEE
jgi:hypothetical protein